MYFIVDKISGRISISETKEHKAQSCNHKHRSKNPTLKHYFQNRYFPSVSMLFELGLCFIYKRYDELFPEMDRNLTFHLGLETVIWYWTLPGFLSYQLLIIFIVDMCGGMPQKRLAFDRLAAIKHSTLDFLFPIIIGRKSWQIGGPFANYYHLLNICHYMSCIYTLIIYYCSLCQSNYAHFHIRRRSYN